MAESQDAPRPVGPGWGGSLVDHSGVTPDAASHEVVPYTPARMYLLVYNVDATGDLWINFGAAATLDQPSILVAAGDMVTWGDGGGFVPDNSVHLIAAAGVHYTIKVA